MSAAAPMRFNFDLDLGHREEKNRVLTDSAVEALIAEARAAGYAEGQAAGEQNATAKATRQLASSAAALGDRVATFAAEIDNMRKANLADAIDLAAAIAKKLAAAMLSERPTGEIEALIAECLASIDGAPHLVIRCNPDLCDAVREIATQRAAVAGFAGRLVVLGEPEITRGDCRLEWVNGGLVRDMEALVREIDQRIAGFLDARGIRNGTTDAGEQVE